MELFSIFGGIFLMIGAFTTMRGNIFLSIIIYFFADLCWLGMAFQSHSWFGVFSITVGITLSSIAWYRMNQGVFHKHLKKGEN